mmetsp:Transcript_3662/g.5469  ORF Transcript_3662/g.5469 Transcript_3662/m.5469 type:complete len:309 (+) Transcript_3662:241-1167(+)
MSQSKVHSTLALSWIGVLVWPLMLALPLLLAYDSSPFVYWKLFPSSWYDYDSTRSSHWASPPPLGLCLGISAVAIGQVFVVLYFYFHSHGYLSYKKIAPPSIQVKGAPKYEFWEGLTTHLSQPEGFALLVAYLTVTWMFRLLPPSYYSFQHGIQWTKLAACLVLQDLVQYLMHVGEHRIHPSIYIRSHKPHHRFTNPKLFDAFNGSTFDTIFMILIPLYVTANAVHCNVWTYMAFGSVYANWLTLIHSEYAFPWDKYFRKLGFGTPGDHHVHHKLFDYNYGHLFLWWDCICGTYKNPDHSPRYFIMTQ